MQPRNMSMRGVVDLGAVKAASDAAAQRAAQAAKAPARGAGAPGANAPRLVIDVTEETFERDVLQLSQVAPVVIDFWAEWCGPCKQLGPILEKLAAEYAGAFVLAKVDVDANQRLAAEFGIQGIPAVMAVVAGQLAPLFQGAVPEPQARQYLDQLVQLGRERFGLTGIPLEGNAADEAGEQDEPAGDPLLAAAEAALEAGDLAGAAQAYRNVLSDHPGHVDAKLALGQVELMQRTADVDLAAARAAAAADPSDVDAQCLAADLDVVGGHIEDAFGRLVETVRRTSGDDRNKARLHLLSLFDLVGGDDPRVVKGRSALSAVLF